jgi:hypothetical protein
MAAGKQIDFSDVQHENALSPMSRSFEPDSNNTLSSDVQSVKHCTPIISTEAGTQIDFSDVHFENALSPI